MNIKEAAVILGIDFTTKITETDLKKKYRMLAKRNHPDLGGSEDKIKSINEAYTCLKNNLNSISKADIDINKRQRVHKDVAVISLGDLIKVYKGESINLANDKNNIIIDKNNINTFEVKINIELDIVYNGKRYKFKELQERDGTKDNYTIYCSIDNFADVVDNNIYIFINNKQLTYSMSSDIKKIRVNFDYIATIDLYVERKSLNG